MRYFQKKDTPQFFIDDTENLREKLSKLDNKKDKNKVWNSDYKKKKNLKEFILEKEQDYLCCYCECKIDTDNTHIEHIKPKHLDLENLTFDYKNLIISCQGNTLSNSNRESSCGHNKDKNFDDNLFLNPTIEKNIQKSFYYSIETGEILSEDEKGEYMIKILNLNDKLNNLPRARRDSLEAFEEVAKNFPIEKRKEILNRKNYPFISFLQFAYKNIDK